MPNFIPGDGPSSARLMVIGEAPGGHEDEQGIPFCGPSGDLVNEMLEKAGISRSDVYVTNVCKIRPPNNELRRISEYGKTLNDFIPILWNEINAIKPNAILALGDTALKVLTGKTGISKYRGSILQSINGYPKVIPSVHPANLLQHHSEGMWHWKDKAYFQLDFNKAVKESTFQDFSSILKRNLWVCRHSFDLMQFLIRHKDHEKVALDIESYRATPICIALAFTKDEAISIPLVDIMSSENSAGITLTEMTNIWKIILEVLQNDKIKKIGQNFKFDERILNCFGFRIKGFNSDTMLKFHELYSEFPKSLEFQTSILTNEPYYKSEGREYNPKKDDLSRLLLYNAKDAAVTREIEDILEEEIIEKGLSEYFYNFRMKTHYFYMQIEDNGILLDKNRHKEVVGKYKNRLKLNDETLYKLVGREFNIDSSAQCCDLLYNELKLPKRTKRRANGSSTLTADEEALMTLCANVKMSTEKKEIIHCMMTHRSIGKTLGTYLGVPKNV
jgi:uracil-DNA glycosylase family 4